MNENIVSQESSHENLKKDLKTKQRISGLIPDAASNVQRLEVNVLLEKIIIRDTPEPIFIVPTRAGISSESEKKSEFRLKPDQNFFQILVHLLLLALAKSEV